MNSQAIKLKTQATKLKSQETKLKTQATKLKEKTQVVGKLIWSSCRKRSLTNVQVSNCRPTEKHFETWLKETGREAEAKEKKDKSQLEWLSDLMSNVAFRKHWKSFLDLHESGKSTKKDREFVRKQSLLVKTKEKKASLRKQVSLVSTIRF